MVKTKRRKNEGFTLLELTIAVAVFLIILAGTARALVSYYVAMDVQNQKFAAVRDCTAVLNAMRNVRDASPDAFPDAIIAEWPDNSVVTDLGSMTQQTITVQYTNVSANPLQVNVTSQWLDLRGRTLNVSVATMLTDR
ncbi:MAG: type II secretion system protein [bacterium]|nr:type II secretion system protein [bacterium]